jgi:hypothetical protein
MEPGAKLIDVKNKARMCGNRAATLSSFMNSLNKSNDGRAWFRGTDCDR